MAWALQIPGARRPHSVWYPKDETNGRIADLNLKPFMIPPKGDTCPINDLPPELLSRIFQFGTSEVDGGYVVGDEIAGFNSALRDVNCKNTTDDQNGDESAREHVIQEPSKPLFSFRTNISLVSRYWRNVAITIPPLWTTITVPSLLHDHSSYTLLPPLLERSGSLPIDINLAGGCLPDVYPLLLPHACRWHSIKAVFRSYLAMDAFFRAVKDPSPFSGSRLTTLQLYRKEDNPNLTLIDSIPPKHFTIFGGSAPSLERLTLCGVYVDWNQTWISSASNLTYLELAFHVEYVCPTWAQFTAILRGAPSLKILRLCASGPSRSPADWSITSEVGDTVEDLVRLLHLTDFFIGFRMQICAVGLIRRFYMPSLTTLAFQFRTASCAGLIMELARPVTSLLPPSLDGIPQSLLSQLENLHIISLPCDQEAIEMLYSELHKLKSLNIVLCHHWHPSPTFLDVLLFPCTLPGQDVWLPLLETLYVSQISDNFPLVRLVVERRKEAGVPLRSLYLEESCGIDLENLTWFKENVETFGFFEHEHRALVNLLL